MTTYFKAVTPIANKLYSAYHHLMRGVAIEYKIREWVRSPFGPLFICESYSEAVHHSLIVWECEAENVRKCSTIASLVGWLTPGVVTAFWNGKLENLAEPLITPILICDAVRLIQPAWRRAI